MESDIELKRRSLQTEADRIGRTVCEALHADAVEDGGSMLDPRRELEGTITPRPLGPAQRSLSAKQTIPGEVLSAPVLPATD
ncbi:hypothetical protein [Streptomyces sp. NPDC015125]|uniref:hypothetical protein n=1 Tax=Streptomyces sp. NPDC015125 TaxID=3364938 RepID=UPI0037004528